MKFPHFFDNIYNNNYWSRRSKSTPRPGRMTPMNNTQDKSSSPTISTTTHTHLLGSALSITASIQEEVNRTRSTQSSTSSSLSSSLHHEQQQQQKQQQQQQQQNQSSNPPTLPPLHTQQQKKSQELQTQQMFSIPTDSWQDAEETMKQNEQSKQYQHHTHSTAMNHHSIPMRSFTPSRLRHAIDHHRHHHQQDELQVHGSHTVGLRRRCPSPTPSSHQKHGHMILHISSSSSSSTGITNPLVIADTHTDVKSHPKNQKNKNHKSTPTFSEKVLSSNSSQRTPKTSSIMNKLHEDVKGDEEDKVDEERVQITCTTRNYKIQNKWDSNSTDDSTRTISDGSMTDDVKVEYDYNKNRLPTVGVGVVEGINKNTEVSTTPTMIQRSSSTYNYPFRKLHLNYNHPKEETMNNPRQFDIYETDSSLSMSSFLPPKSHKNDLILSASMNDKGRQHDVSEYIPDGGKVSTSSAVHPSITGDIGTSALKESHVVHYVTKEIDPQHSNIQGMNSWNQEENNIHALSLKQEKKEMGVKTSYSIDELSITSSTSTALLKNGRLYSV